MEPAGQEQILELPFKMKPAAQEQILELHSKLVPPFGQSEACMHPEIEIVVGNNLQN